VKPAAVISGSKTGLSNPQGVALDPVNGDIYVANFDGTGPSGEGSITIYSPGSHGNVAPIGTIAGASTGIHYPEGLVLDARGRIYVPNSGGPSGAGSITVYPAKSRGNVAPTQTIAGAYTKLAGPSAVALDSSFNMYAANDQENAISVYAAGASGNVAPIRMIWGRRTKLDNPLGAALDASGNTYAANNYYDSVNAYAAGANGNAKPTGIIAGIKTKLNSPKGIAIR
jgi:DNA-binding beta-propeller fold protein YncE